MSRDELLALSAAELGRRIARGAVSAREATLAVLEALGEASGLNDVARLRPEAALAQADAADAARARGTSAGPLHGVPFAHKDMFPRAGEVAEYGSIIFRGAVARRTATAIQRLDAAGAVDVGRLNMVEFALGITGHNPHTGHPRNAWDRSRITGGSSSGGATSVAARRVFGSLGSDSGGSIRLPASLCGLVGLKPTYGLVSRAGAMPLSPSLDHVGLLARTAEDCALMLEAIAGADPADPLTSRRPPRGYGAALGREIAGVRIGVVVGGLDTEVAPAVEAACRAATQVLSELGAELGDVRLPDVPAINACRRAVLLVEGAILHRELMATRRPEYNPQTAERMAPGFALSAVDYGRALAAREPLLRRFIDDAFARADVLALPTSPVAAAPIEATDTGGDMRYMALANTLGALVGPFNYLGLPAVSVPVGVDPDGLPIGLQLVGRPFIEALLLRVAHGLQRARGEALTGLVPPRPAA